MKWDRTSWLLAASLLTVLLPSIGSEASDAVSLRGAVPARPPSLGNPYASLSTGGIHPWGYIFDALTALSADGTVKPALATEWGPITATRWRFKLRPDVRFSNGDPFSADTVVAVFQYLKQGRVDSQFASNEARAVADVVKVDNLTIEITTQAPDPILDRRMSLIFMVPERAWREMGSEAFSRQPVGTGPFRLTDWGMSSGKYFLDRYKDSWRGRGPISHIELQIVPDATARVQALVSGRVDLALNLGLDALDDLRARGFTVLARERSPVEGIALPNVLPASPLADARVRVAMNLAVNREALAQTLMHGLTRPNGQGVLPEMFGFNPAIEAYPYDPARAKALLAEAGFPKGFSLTLAARVDSKGPEWASAYEAIAQDLARVKIEVTIRTVTSPKWLQMWTTGDWEGADITPFSWTSTYGDAGRAIETVSCSKAGAFFCIPGMNAQIQKAALEMNVDERRKKLQTLLKDMHALAPNIYLFAQIETLAYSSLVGALPFESGFYRLEDASVGAKGR